jgi:two-component system, cell cycle response regulator DivK
VTGAPGPRRILIVEDNEKNLKLVRDILLAIGYETLEARNAESGVALATTELPDLVLMDIGLPDVDGVTALGRLRADARTSSIRVVALTAYAMADDRERLLGAGFDGYLQKPINVRAFPKLIEDMLRLERPEVIA